MKKVQLFLITLMLLGCDSKKEFDSNVWKQKGVDWWMTDIRERIVDDLVQSDTLIGLNKIEVIELLGQPEANEDLELNYLIREKYGYDIDPEYISVLIIQFDKNGKAILCKKRRRGR